MSAADKKKRFESLMPSRTETPPHKSEVIDTLMGQTSNADDIGTPKTRTEFLHEETVSHTSEVVYPPMTTTTTTDNNGTTDNSFDIAARIRAFEEQRRSRPSYDELYTKHTFLIRKDLMERLERASARHSRGFKTRFINELLEAGLTQLEVED